MQTAQEGKAAGLLGSRSQVLTCTPSLPTITPLYSSRPWLVHAGLHTRVAFIELPIGRKKKKQTHTFSHKETPRSREPSRTQWGLCQFF